MKSIELKPFEIIETDYKPEEQTQEIPIWKFYEKDDPEERANWYYCKCTKDILVDVLEGFRMEVDTLDDNCMYVPDFVFCSCPETHRMLIVKCNGVDTDDDIDFNVYVHKDCRLPLYSWEGRKAVWYSDRFFID